MNTQDFIDAVNGLIATFTDKVKGDQAQLSTFITMRDFAQSLQDKNILTLDATKVNVTTTVTPDETGI